MEMETRIKKAATALLSMQRHSWEQGVAMQAFLEMGERDVVIAMAQEAVYRSMEDGRTATIGVADGITDPCAVGEALLMACEWTDNPVLLQGKEALLHWALKKAPRSSKGVIYHLTTGTEFWVDSLYMLPPFLAAAGYIPEALTNFYGYVQALYDTEAHLMCHMWNEETGELVRGAHWGTGNGWALASIARLIPILRKKQYIQDTDRLISLGHELLDALLQYLREDGLFYDVVDDENTFIETNLSQMTAYTIYRGITDDWLEEHYREPASRMRAAANHKMNDYGFIEGVCGAPTFDKPGFSPEGQAFYLLMEQAAYKEIERK